MTTGQPNATDPLILSRDTERARLVRAARQRLKPTQVPEVYLRSSRRRQNTDRISQEVAAGLLVGSSRNWYRLAEQPAPVRMSEDLVERIAAGLRMTPTERRTLYVCATGHLPPVNDAGPCAGLSASVAQLISGQSVPALAVDPHWNVMACNASAEDWFAWLSGGNPNWMVWALTCLDARRQLGRWEQDWAPALIAEFRLTAVARQADHRLERLLHRLLDDEEVRRIWEEVPPASRPGIDGRAYWGLNIPGQDRLTRVELLNLSPGADTQTRVMAFIPVDGHARAVKTTPPRATAIETL